MEGNDNCLILDGLSGRSGLPVSSHAPSHHRHIVGEVHQGEIRHCFIEWQKDGGENGRRGYWTRTVLLTVVLSREWMVFSHISSFLPSISPTNHHSYQRHLLSTLSPTNDALTSHRPLSRSMSPLNDGSSNRPVRRNATHPKPSFTRGIQSRHGRDFSRELASSIVFSRSIPLLC